VNEQVAQLVLGGSPQAFGTYGSSGSAAQFKIDEYFFGPGMVTVAPVPEPASLSVIVLAGAAAMRRRRRA
jgi:hypothetical protein